MFEQHSSQTCIFLFRGYHREYMLFFELCQIAGNSHIMTITEGVVGRIV